MWLPLPQQIFPDTFAHGGPLVFVPKPTGLRASLTVDAFVYQAASKSKNSTAASAGGIAAGT